MIIEQKRKHSNATYIKKNFYMFIFMKSRTFVYINHLKTKCAVLRKVSGRTAQ
jgi:hypothetical protein